MHYGLWTPFIDEPNLFDWYRLPADAQAELVAFVSDGSELEPLRPEQFRSVHRVFVAYANRSVHGLPYHNPTHFKHVEQAGLSAAGAIERLTGRSFPTAVLQNLRLALRLHDCHHPGSTLRVDAPGPEQLYRPELGTGVSTEWVSAAAAWDLSRKYRLAVPARLFQTQIIWSSTFGGHLERAARHGIPIVQPAGLWGRIMRAADVCPPASFDRWLAAAVAVNYAEVSAVPAPTTWDGFLDSQIGFSNYIEYTFDRLDDSAGVPVTTDLGWRRRLHGHLSNLQLIISDSAPVHAAGIHTELAKRGIDLQ